MPYSTTHLLFFAANLTFIEIKKKEGDAFLFFISS